MIDLNTLLGSTILLLPHILWMLALLDKPSSNELESVIRPNVEAYASNLQYDDEVVTYDDLLEQQHNDFLAMSYGHSEEV